MIGCLRSLGTPARYVSGYLVPRQGVVGDQASHAWISTYCPQFGWVDFDPTNGVVVSNGHLTVAWGRDYADVCPLRGVILGGGKHIVEVAGKVTPSDGGAGSR
jgi:transglutaminase-like putative cysteine protease